MVAGLSEGDALSYGAGFQFQAAIGGASLDQSAGELPEFATVALGIAGVEDGARFTVPQTSGYHFIYQRSGEAASFIDWDAISAEAASSEAQISSYLAAYSATPLASSGVLILTASARRWDARLIENVYGDDPPTLNVIDPLFLRDEDGGTTPVLTKPSPATDPLGNTQATRMEFSGASIALSTIQRVDNTSWTTSYTGTISMQARLAGGEVSLGLGSSARTAGAYTSAALTSDWQTISASIPNYSVNSTYNISILPVSAGGTYPATADVYGLQCHFDTGPIALPSLNAERLGQMSSHAKASAGYPQAIPVDASGVVRPNAGSFSNVVMPINRATVSQYTMGGWIDVSKQDYAGSWVNIAAFGRQTDYGTNVLQTYGAIGMDVSPYGRLYSEPSSSTNAGRCPTQVQQQGMVHLAVRVVRGVGDSVTITPYINGVPLYDVADTVPAFTPETIMLGGYASSLKRRQSGNGQVQSPDGWADIFFTDTVLSEDEISSIYLAGRSLYAPTQKKMLTIFCSDSLMSFADAPSWDTADTASLRPGFHGALDAIGGTFYATDGSNYAAAARRDLRQRMLKYGAAHYDRVLAFWPYGHNDITAPTRPMGTSSPFGGWQQGSVVIDNMIFEDRDSVPLANRSKIKNVITTVIPDYNWLVTGPEEEDIRQDYNAYRRAGWASQGYDYFLDVAAWVPPGFASFEAACLDTGGTTANSVYLTDGIHWSTTGGANVAADIHVPFFRAILDEVQGV